MAAYAIAMLARLVEKSMWSEISRGVCVGLLVILGLILILEALLLLSRGGFDPIKRDPNPVPAAMAIGGATLAFWQIVNKYLSAMIWSNSIVIAILVYISIFLFFESPVGFFVIWLGRFM